MVKAFEALMATHSDRMYDRVQRCERSLVSIPNRGIAQKTVTVESGNGRTLEGCEKGAYWLPACCRQIA